MKRNFPKLWLAIGEASAGTFTLGLLTLISFRLHANSTTVALLYLIVIVLISLRGRLILAALIGILAYVCLDYFFTAPLFTLGLNQPLDFLAPIAYVATAFVITRLISNLRKAEESRKLAEERLRKSQAELAHVARVMTMGELAASIAHEINQPLTAVVTNGSACLRWLSGNAPNLEEAREAAGRIIRDGHRAGEVMNRIRAFLRKTDSTKSQVNINQLIQEVVNLLRDETKAHAVRVRLNLADDIPAVVGDRVQLQQVVLNLLMNGIEAVSQLPDGAKEILVRSCQHESDYVLVTVQDSGSGIDQQNNERIFDAFYSTKANGLGMGLAISRSIIEDHGGRLWALTNGKPGATFQFTLLKYR